MVGWVLWGFYWGGEDGGGCLGFVEEFWFFDGAIIGGEGGVGGVGGWAIGLKFWKLDLDIDGVGVGFVAASFLGTLGWKWEKRGVVMMLGPNMSWRHGGC